MCVLMNPVTGSLIARYNSFLVSASPGSASAPLFRLRLSPMRVQLRLPLSSESVVSFSSSCGSCSVLGIVGLG